MICLLYLKQNIYYNKLCVICYNQNNKVVDKCQILVYFNSNFDLHLIVIMVLDLLVIFV